MTEKRIQETFVVKTEDRGAFSKGANVKTVPAGQGLRPAQSARPAAGTGASSPNPGSSTGSSGSQGK